MNLARNLVSRDARFPSECSLRVAANQACPASPKNTERCRIREGGDTFRRSQVVDLGEVRETLPGEGRTPPDSASRSRHHQGRCVQHRTRCHQVARDQWQQETGAAQLGAQAAGAQQLGAAAGAQQLGAAGRRQVGTGAQQLLQQPLFFLPKRLFIFLPQPANRFLRHFFALPQQPVLQQDDCVQQVGAAGGAAGRRGGRAQQVGAAGAQQGAGAAQVGAGAQQLGAGQQPWP